MEFGEFGTVRMYETNPYSFRRNLSTKRSFRAAVGADDRGWTLLHIGARKGDLVEVRYFLAVFPLIEKVQVLGTWFLFLFLFLFFYCLKF